MITYFPAPYPDELFYSVLCRYHVHSGTGLYRATAEQVFANPLEHPDILFMNQLSPELTEIMAGQISIERLIKEHTMFSCYARFLPEERKQRAMDALLSGDRRSRMLLRASMAGKPVLRYCPVCAKEDRKARGETWWHRAHQMPGIRVCPAHGSELRETDIRLDCRMSPGFWPAESVVPEACEITALPVSEKERGIAAYMAQVMEEPLHPHNDTAARFLHSRLIGTPYCSARGKQRNIQHLYEDMCSCFSAVPGLMPVSRWRLDKIFSDQRWYFEEICALGLFLHILPEAMEERTIPAIPPEEAFDQEVLCLRQQRMSYPAIAKHLGVSVNLVKPIGEGRRQKKSSGTEPCAPKHNGPYTRDWEKEDAALLPEVKKLYRCWKALMAAARVRSVYGPWREL